MAKMYTFKRNYGEQGEESDVQISHDTLTNTDEIISWFLDYEKTLARFADDVLRKGFNEENSPKWFIENKLPIVLEQEAKKQFEIDPQGIWNRYSPVVMVAVGKFVPAWEMILIGDTDDFEY